MSIKEVHTYKQKLDYLFTRGDFFFEDLELRAHWTRYLCVHVSNFLDNSVQNILINYSRESGSEFVARYATSRLVWEYNLNAEKLTTMVRAFNKEWGEQLERFIIGERSEAINSVLGNRHIAVHGYVKANLNIGFVQLKVYYKKIWEVVEFLISLCATC